jgi:type II secretory ATPase GspE/PulE/Tfp pilus assembly ATPase PilB-like protein
VLPISENLQSLIARNASEGELRAAAREEGNFASMREDAALKVQKGITTLEEAAAKVVL